MSLIVKPYIISLGMPSGLTKSTEHPSSALGNQFGCSVDFMSQYPILMLAGTSSRSGTWYSSSPSLSRSRLQGGLVVSASNALACRSGLSQPDHSYTWNLNVAWSAFLQDLLVVYCYSHGLAKATLDLQLLITAWTIGGLAKLAKNGGGMRLSIGATWGYYLGLLTRWSPFPLRSEGASTS